MNKKKSCNTCLLAIFLLITGCGVLTPKEPDPDLDFIGKHLTSEQSNNLAKEVAGNFFYGQGFGQAIVNVTTIIFWPPYAIYILGNGVISLSGYEPLLVTNLLPQNIKDSYDTGYDTVTSVPGRITAAIAGQRFRTKSVIKDRQKKLLKKT